MMSGRYGRPSEAVAMLTLRFSGACADALAAKPTKRNAESNATPSLRMGFLRGHAPRGPQCRHKGRACQAPVRELAPLWDIRARIEDRPQVLAVVDLLH